MVVTFERYIGFDFVIDANRINAKGTEPNMNQLEKWRQNGVISLVISNEASTEVRRGKTGAKRLQKAHDYVHTVTKVRTEDEKRLLTSIETMLFPGGARNQNEENDVLIVFNAHKYCDYLITEDGRSWPCNFFFCKFIGRQTEGGFWFFMLR